MLTKKNILDFKLRRNIYQFISENPGLNITEICLRMKIRRSALRHHLRYLMKLDMISINIYKKNKRFYVCEQVGVKDRELVSLLRQEVPFKIIIYLFFPGFCSKSELARDLKIHISTVDFHIKKLLDMDVIAYIEVKDGKFISHHHHHKPVVFKKPVGREKFYVWKNLEIAEDFYRLLITHRDSMIDPNIIAALSDFIKEWYKLGGYKKSKKHFNFDSTVDNVIQIFEEVFHFPFHL